MIGLAAVVALVAISAVGVTSASAEAETVLCKANEEKCKGANYIGYAFSADATGMKFKLSESGTTQCSGTMVRGEDESVTTLSFSSCTEGCTVTAKSLPYTANMFEPIAGNGKLSMTITGLAVKCGTNECVYSGALEKLPVTGGTPAVIKVNNTLNEEAKNILCPKSVLWEGEYKLKATTAFVTKRATGPVFCTVNKAPCPAESTRLKPEFHLQAKTSFVAKRSTARRSAAAKPVSSSATWRSTNPTTAGTTKRWRSAAAQPRCPTRAARWRSQGRLMRACWKCSANRRA